MTGSEHIVSPESSIEDMMNFLSGKIAGVCKGAEALDQSCFAQAMPAKSEEWLICSGAFETLKCALYWVHELAEEIGAEIVRRRKGNEHD